MEAVIKHVAKRTGVSRSIAERAVAILLRVIRDEGDDEAVKALFTAFPEADSLVDEADARDEETLETEMGERDDLTEGALALQALGLEDDQIELAVNAFFDQVREELDEEQAMELIESVPALAQYL